MQQRVNLLYHIFLNFDLSTSPGAIFGVIAYKGLSSHPVEKCKDNDDVTSVSVCFSFPAFKCIAISLI